MTIRKKTLLIISLAFFVLITAQVLISRFFVFNGFKQLEVMYIRVNVERAVNVIAERLANIDVTAEDWASWDDTYEFIKDRNAQYIESNLEAGTCVTLNVNFMLFFDAEWNLIAGKHVALTDEQETPIPDALLDKIVSPGDTAIGQEGLRKRKGILLIGGMPALVAFRPILRSDDSGPARGVLVIGRYLDKHELRHFSDIAQLSFSVYPVSTPEFPFDASDTDALFAAQNSILTKTTTGQIGKGFTGIKDIFEKPALILEVRLPRYVYFFGRKVWLFSMGFYVLTCLGLGMGVLLLLEKNVLSPLKRLKESVAELGDKDHGPLHLPIDRNDELGGLAEKINEMLDQIEEHSTQLKKDIEERKQAEIALKESEERYRSILEAVPNTISIIGLKNEDYKEINEAFTLLTGYGRDEIIGKTPGDLGGFLDLADYHRILFQIREHGRISGMGLKMRKKDGDRMDVLLSARTMKYDDEECVVASIIDDTERKNTEAEKIELEYQLQRAQKMEAIGALAGGVAHDLNNILSGIVSYPELLLMETPKDSPLHGPIMTIKKSGERAAAIVQDLLSLARRDFVDYEVLILNEVVEEYLGSLECERLCTDHPGVVVESRLQENLPGINGSRVHLLKVVMNLVSNSADAMPAGGKIVISTGNRHIDAPLAQYERIKEGHYVVLTLSDAGAGIDKEDLNRIFEPFYTKKIMGLKGTGLGLAVVWGTVKDHKGYIDVDSTKGKGTIFTLYFPVSEKKPVTKALPVSMEHITGKGEVVLIVDDSEEQRHIASIMLRRLGYNVFAVSSGEKAVLFVKDKDVDVLVLDMIMDPGMDGLDTYRQIIEIRPGQKAIIASGFSETDRVREAQRLGAGEYITKPYSMERIGMAVKNALGKKR